MSNCPDWLPDWRDVTQYPDSKKTSAAQWAWEFLRRNQKYQAMYDEYVRPFTDEYGTIDNEAAYTYEKKKRRQEILAAKKTRKTVYILGPINSFQKSFGLLIPIAPEYSDQKPSFESHWMRVFKGSDSLESRTVSVEVGKHEAYLYFRTDMPIEQQLERAKRTLKIINKTNPKKLPRLRKAEFQSLLRMLDGEAMGVKTKEMAKVLYPKVQAGPYGTAVQRIYQGLERAKQLRDEHYRYVSWNFSK
ncbi:MAG: transcriptional regulator domain-containing protein [Rickettsiales bacterium]